MKNKFMITYATEQLLFCGDYDDTPVCAITYDDKYHVVDILCNVYYNIALLCDKFKCLDFYKFDIFNLLEYETDITNDVIVYKYKGHYDFSYLENEISNFVKNRIFL
jgi:hypothetical protein